VISRSGISFLSPAIIVTMNFRSTCKFTFFISSDITLSSLEEVEIEVHFIQEDFICQALKFIFPHSQFSLIKQNLACQNAIVKQTLTTLSYHITFVVKTIISILSLFSFAISCTHTRGD
jgi:hypothetical protein